MPYTAEEVAARCQEIGNVWFGAYDGGHFRAVTHYWVGAAEVKTFLDVLCDVLR